MTKFLLKTHRIFGLIFLPIMLVWFISGYFMLLGGFPHISKQWVNQHQPLLPKKVITNKSVTSYREISYCAYGWREINQINNTEKDTVFLSIYTTTKPVACDQYAQHLTKEQPTKKIILEDLDTWIPWSRLKKDLPIYKYTYNDGLQLYISSRTGEVVQRTTTKERWIAYFGAIPHWLYFKWLRQHTSTWINVIKVLCVFCLIAIVSGYLYGWIIFFKARKSNPYKRKNHKYHFALGLPAGLIILTWTLSGFFSLHHVAPSWAPIGVKKKVKSIWTPQPITVQQNLTSIDYTKPIVAISWKNIGGKVMTKMIDHEGQETFYNPGSVKSNFWTPLYLKERFKQLLPKNEITMTKGENNQLNIKVNDQGKSTFTFDLIKGELIHYEDSNTRLNNFLYRGLHAFKIGKLNHYPIIRISLILIFLTIGTAVLITGLFITIHKK
ncbi:PepSY domain-containing protein [Halosquirtibacter xylanolyticus]|uniref:PepSY domain-containing protein n=1 Tax=Halosquirtibacter xylanolyticus TaxID=3374599 RepID=UPI0037485643|nr:PepSY domain-containing protein [Prolixibacteraceae bacterium]